MGKTIDIPANITFTTIEGNSDVGDLSDNGDGTFNVANIDTTDVRNAIGGSTNAIGALSTNPNVNRWSLFKPDRNKISGDEIIYDVVSPYPIGEFAAYDHQAGPDDIMKMTYQSYIPSASGADVTVSLIVEQMNWYAELDPDLTDYPYLILKVSESGTNVANDAVALEDKGGSQQYTCSVFLSDGDYTFELYIGTYVGGHYYPEGKLPFNDWQYSVTVHQLSEPTASLLKDTYDSTLDEETLVDDGTTVDVGDNYSINFHFDNQDAAIWDGKIYVMKNSSYNWILLLDSLYWGIGHDHQYTGNLNDEIGMSVDYDDDIAFLITTNTQ